MSLYVLSGAETPVISGDLGRKKGGLKKIIQKVKKPFAKVGLSPARGAFLALVRLNVFGLAKKLAKAYQKDPQKVLNFWTKFEGDTNILKETIRKGSKIKISGSIGQEPASSTTAATAVATATPILIAVVKLFKELGIKDHKENGGTIQEGIENGKKILSESAEKTDVIVNKGTELVKEIKGGGESPEGNKTAKETQKTNMPLLLGGGALALFLATRPKK
jgi:hypothetical protein